MTDKVSLPPPSEPITLAVNPLSPSYSQTSKSAGKKISEPWYRWFTKVNTVLNSAGDSIDSITAASTSGQISFPATQNPSTGANVLDDYEEGTWTPGVEFGDDATGVTYSAQAGTYTKIGRLVHLSCDITLTNNGSGTGRCDINNLPFASPDAVSDCYGHFVVMSGGAAVPAAVLGNVGGTNIFLFTQASTGQASLTEANVTDTGRIRGSIIYETT